LPLSDAPSRALGGLPSGFARGGAIGTDGPHRADVAREVPPLVHLGGPVPTLAALLTVIRKAIAASVHHEAASATGHARMEVIRAPQAYLARPMAVSVFGPSDDVLLVLLLSTDQADARTLSIRDLQQFEAQS